MKKCIPLLLCSQLLTSCKGSTNTSLDDNSDNSKEDRVEYPADAYVMGADISYVNQILYHGGAYKDSGHVKITYEMFSGYGTCLVRLRLWHDTAWTAEVDEGKNNALFNFQG